MDETPTPQRPKSLDRVKAKWFGFILVGLVVGIIMFLILGFYLNSKYYSFKTKTIDAIRWNIDQSFEREKKKDKGRESQREKLKDKLDTIYGYAEDDRLSFVAMAVVTQSYDVTMADEYLSDSEIVGLLDLYGDIIAKEGSIPIKEVEEYTKKAERIR